MTEIEMVDKALQYWKTFGIPAWIEIGCLGNSIDVVLKKGGYIEAVEFKLSDWKTAIKQAVRHRVAVDKSYVCLPHYLSSDTFAKATSRSVDMGVGIYVFNNLGVRTELEAPKENTMLWSVGRKWIVRDLLSKSDLKWIGHEDMKTLFGGGK